jgi:hypothetical protein
MYYFKSKKAKSWKKIPRAQCLDDAEQWLHLYIQVHCPTKTIDDFDIYTKEEIQCRPFEELDPRAKVVATTILKLNETNFKTNHIVQYELNCNTQKPYYVLYEDWDYLDEWIGRFVDFDDLKSCAVDKCAKLSVWWIDSNNSVIPIDLNTKITLIDNVSGKQLLENGLE